MKKKKMSDYKFISSTLLCVSLNSTKKKEGNFNNDVCFFMDYNTYRNRK